MRRALPPLSHGTRFLLTILTDARRAATLLQDIGALWSHPGVSTERQKEFIDEIFGEIQFDQHGIRVVLPRTEYRALVALTEVSRGGMVGATGFEPATS